MNNRKKIENIDGEKLYSKNMKNERIENVSKIRKTAYLIEDIIYYAVVIILSIITLMVAFQSIFMPDKIPNIFGYKLFISFSDKYDESIKNGDLLFTKNIDTNILVEGNVIAFRNNMNLVTLHRINSIETITDKDGNELKRFTMNALENETNDTKYIIEDKVEGLLVKRIPKVGEILYIIQKPVTFAIIIGIILVIGLIMYYVASKLDKRDIKKMEEKIRNMKEEEKSKELIFK